MFGISVDQLSDPELDRLVTYTMQVADGDREPADLPTLNRLVFGARA